MAEIETIPHLNPAAIQATPNEWTTLVRTFLRQLGVVDWLYMEEDLA
ncbi:MAG: hypothetical protein JJU11_11385 [Candidatus Sumerlaeia bacterium]|nr:hypothetical protein [Candidatus Sumerlaeia bacterium]